MKKGIISIASAIAGAATGAGITAKQVTKETKRQKELSDKHFALYLLMNQWVKVKQENKSIASYLEKKGYRDIAIYGMNYVGETLLGELAGSGVNVKYAIDRNADNIYTDVDVVMPDASIEKVDAIIVTPVTFFDEIEEMLSWKTDCPILSMEDILYEV
ncbi:MAG: hypothetical protein HDR17_13180 [Lachnospiraceae bacterium]|nr:hypothetical protein [Lachnospiraceae bacterium]